MNLGTLLVCVTLCLLAGVGGSVATRRSLFPWYQDLRKPPLTPPNWLFGPAWGVLFVLMGVALAMVVESAPSDARTTFLRLFFLQLVLNVLWSWIFFGFRAPGWALLEIVLFLGAVVATWLVAGRIGTGPSWLLLPYVAWVAFATYLNLGVYLLNRSRA